jgi:hypothetical protein
MSRLLIALLLATLAATTARARVEIPITTCGQYVLRGQVGILMTDLACGHQWGTCFACATAGLATCPQIQPAVPCAGPSDCPDPAVNECDGSTFPVSIGVRLEPGARLYLTGIRSARRDRHQRQPTGTAGSNASGWSDRDIFKTRGGVLHQRVVQRRRTLTDSPRIVALKMQLKDVDTSGNVIGERSRRCARHGSRPTATAWSASSPT